MSENVPLPKCAIETCAAKAMGKDTLCSYHLAGAKTVLEGYKYLGVKCATGSCHEVTVDNSNFCHLHSGPVLTGEVAEGLMKILSAPVVQRLICTELGCFKETNDNGRFCNGHDSKIRLINSKGSEEKYGVNPDLAPALEALKELNETAAKTANELFYGDDPATITKMLNGRENIYGDFLDVAETCQDLKAVFCKRTEGKEEKFAADQIEAIEMIFLKISRVINGDPDYKDSWVDIAGYAQLIVNRLEKEETNV